MDKSASIAAAFGAGKLPSQQQLSKAIDNALNSPFLTNKPSIDVGELSEQGQQLQDSVRQLLLAYKKLGDNKNSDDIIQESIWHLSEADLSNSSTNAMDVDTDQAKSDARALAHSLRVLVSVVSDNLTNEGRSVFHDFASFMRLALADAADQVSGSAHNAAEVLREVDSDVAEGQRNEIGMKRKAEDDPEDADARVKFEKGMDSVKDVGSKAIGAGQVAAQTTQDLANRTSSRLQDAFYKVCDRAQSDVDYHKAISTIFELADKWVHRSLDTVGDVNKSTDLDDFIDDPTPEKHLITAIRGMRQVIERLANNKSLDDFFGALRVCGVDIQQDPAIRDWFDKFIAYLRKNLDERGYARSEESQKKREELRHEWKELSSKDSDKGRKWKEDFATLRREATEFQRAIDRDEDLRDVRRARARLGEDIENTLLAAGTAGAQTFMERAPWFWQDLFNVYLPRLVESVKDIPIPRTEYKDDEVEFVLEDLDISKFSFLPGHAYIRNITDIDIKAPSAGQTETAIGTLTRIYLQGLQIQLKEVSFYYYDKTTSMGPAEFNGLLEFTLPPQGVDVDVVVRSIPNSPEGKLEREKRESFLDIQRVDVKVSEDVNLTVKQSNHQILVSVFRPIMLSRLRETLQTILQQQIHGALQSLDKMAWDVGRRAEVFEDTGLPRGASLLAGFWSELGHFQRSSDRSLLSGWKATGTGVIKDDNNTQFAMGAEPQVLSGDKHGPKGTFSDSVGERVDRNVDVDATVKDAKGVAEQATEVVKGKYRQVKSWTDTVQQKTEEERQRSGWNSPAFDALWA
ncbi:hypothetical protein BD311DRAFT_677580 [Dichomitus squalens]|uniref:Uncharacterized protein n=1 Tax=Dichomitus squalens TaxID=114155 RepID=A0A4Q9M7X4_9APHY|nr:hypothetical protein BD311DRAFT_677580 [Dichomitus squalens]